MGNQSNQNQKLLNRLKETVLENLSNEQFGVEDLSKELGISRSHLHRKLKLLKGNSISQYIRQIRLEEAMKMLQSEVGNSSDVAYKVGFGSTSYFSKCFSDLYGFSPGEVKKMDLEELKIKRAFQSTIEDKNKINKAGNPFTFFQKGSYKYYLVALVFAVTLFFIFIYKPFTSNAIKSIAVLPLQQLSAEGDQDYLAAGLQDALIGELGKVNGIRVISRTSTLKYLKAEKNLQEIAEELGVDVLVEGSVFLKGDSLRLQIQLVEAFPEENHIWAQEYYQDIRNVLSLQGNLVKDMARAIELSLSPEEEKHLLTRREVNPETYKAYLRGMYFLNKSSREDFKKGMAFLQEAVENDPADPLAYAGLALGYINLGHSASTSYDAFLRAKAAALQALKLDSTLIEAHAALGRIYLYYEWDWAAAERTFKYVNEVNPSMATNHYHYAWYLHLFGRKEEAIFEHELAQKYDPLGAKNTAWLAWLYAYYGEYQKAEIEIENAFELDAEYSTAYLASALNSQLQGNFDEAISTLEKLVDKYPFFIHILGITYAQVGRIEDTQEILKNMEHQPISPWNAQALASLNAALGNNAEAIKWLKFKPHHAYVPWFRVIPGIGSLQNDPRFHELLSEMNLPPIPSS